MKTLADRVFELAEEQGEALALAFKKELLSYAELKKAVSGTAVLLRARGVKKGDRVCFTAPSSPETIVVYLGIQAAGGVAVFMDKNSSAESMAQLCAQVGAALLLTDRPTAACPPACEVLSIHALIKQAQETETADFLPAVHDPEELAEMLFTSGTTGKPKAVMLSYRAVNSILHHTADCLRLQSTERVLIPLPLHHSFALRVLRAVLWRGAAVVLQNGFTFARELENNINAYACTGLIAVPSSYELMRGQMQEHFVPVLSKLDFMEFGSGSLNIRQRRELLRLFPNIRITNTWGSSETGGVLFCDLREEALSAGRLNTLGRPVSDVELFVLDENAQPMCSSPDHPGRLAMKGEMLMSGYWDNPEATAQALHGDMLVTNDLVYTDEEGYIFMIGRADDIINVGGEKLSPVELEEAASQFESVRECGVIGVDDPEGILGSVPALFLVVGADFEEKEFRQYLSRKLEKYKQPREIIYLDALPRNQLMKLDRRELRHIYDERGEDHLMNPLMKLILSRQSVRRFREEKIPAPILDMILKAGYHAPSGHNAQSWRFTVLTDSERIAKLKETIRTTAKAKKSSFSGFENPQTLVLLSNDERNADGCQDCSCAAENMMLAALSYGIGSVWLNSLMTLRHEEPVSLSLDELGIPRNHVVWAMIALGYPLSDELPKVKKKDTVVFFPDGKE